MHSLDFLAGLRTALAPPAYLEIGASGLRAHVGDDVKPYGGTSDEYFARRRPPFGGRRIALSLLDGTHLAEFAVRDLANVEQRSEWTSVIVLEGVLPASAEAASRDRRAGDWSGDVYKLLDVLAEHRPNLICLRVDTQPSGLGVILGLDPDSSVLDDRYDEIVRAVVAPDPQDVPADVLARVGALEPEAVLASSVWSLLRRGREAGAHRGLGLRRLRRALRRDLGVSVPRRRGAHA